MYKKILLFLCIILLIPSIAFARPNQIGNQPASQYNIGYSFFKIPSGKEGLSFDKNLNITEYDSFANNYKSTIKDIFADNPSFAIFSNFPLQRYSFDFYSGSTQDPLKKYLATITESITNVIFGLAQAFISLGITLITWAFKVDLVKEIIHWVSTSIQMLMNKNNETWFLLFTWGTIGLLGYASFLFIKRQIGNIAKAIGITLLGIALSFFFYNNTEQLLTSFDDGINAITGAVIEGYAQLPTNANQIDNQKEEGKTAIDRGLSMFGDNVWDVVIGKPWAYAMFGTYNVDDLQLTEEEYALCSGKNQSSIKGWYENLGAPQPQIDLKKAFSSSPWSNIKNDYIDTLYLSTPAIKSPGGIISNADSESPRERVLRILGSDVWGYTQTKIDHGRHPNTPNTLSYSNVGNHLLTATILLIPAGIFIALAISVAGSMILYQILISLMVLFLPMICMLLFIPVTGWQLSLKYFKTLLGFLLVKLIYGIYLSIIMVVAILINNLAF